MEIYFGYLAIAIATGIGTYYFRNLWLGIMVALGGLAFTALFASYTLLGVGWSCADCQDRYQGCCPSVAPYLSLLLAATIAFVIPAVLLAAGPSEKRLA